MKMNWKKIPVDNNLLKEMSLSGNGKDSEFTLKTQDEEMEIYFTMRDPRLVVDIQGNMITESFNYGDIDLGVRYVPQEEIVIVSMEIDFPGDEEDWAKSLNRLNSGQSEFLGWMIDRAKIVLASKKETK